MKRAASKTRKSNNFAIPLPVEPICQGLIMEYNGNHYHFHGAKSDTEQLSPKAITMKRINYLM